MAWAVTAAMAPAIFWVWHFYRQDRRPEPVGWIAGAFLLGAGLIIPVVIVQRDALLPILPNVGPDEDFFKLWLASTVAAGFVEESAKFLVVVALFAFHRDFDEPVDALVYCVAVAMGFTMSEDLLRHLVEVDPGRLVKPPGHALFSMFWGYAIGRNMIDPAAWRVPVGWLAAIVTHGLWNAFAIYSRRPELHVGLTAVLAVATVVLFWRFEVHLNELQERPSAGKAPTDSLA